MTDNKVMNQKGKPWSPSKEARLCVANMLKELEKLGPRDRGYALSRIHDLYGKKATTGSSKKQTKSDWKKEWESHPFYKEHEALRKTVTDLKKDDKKISQELADQLSESNQKAAAFRVEIRAKHGLQQGQVPSSKGGSSKKSKSAPEAQGEAKGSASASKEDDNATATSPGASKNTRKGKK
jgi:hypothetical protein